MDAGFVVGEEWAILNGQVPRDKTVDHALFYWLNRYFYPGQEMVPGTIWMGEKFRNIWDVCRGMMVFLRPLVCVVEIVGGDVDAGFVVGEEWAILNGQVPRDKAVDHALFYWLIRHFYPGQEMVPGTIWRAGKFRNIWDV